jgi:Helix-turn-helix
MGIRDRPRMRRIMLDMSQTKLGDRLGVSFQQVQKYENDLNRIGASRFSINRDDSACAKTHPGTVAGRAYAFDADGGLLLDARRLLAV